MIMIMIMDVSRSSSGSSSNSFAVNGSCGTPYQLNFDKQYVTVCVSQTAENISNDISCNAHNSRYSTVGAYVRKLVPYK